MTGIAYSSSQRRAACPTPLGRFMAKVRKADGCWEWIAGHSKGYGQFYPTRKHYPAHRWLYEFVNGPIPKELDIDHLCRNRGCVNPAHLEPVTPGENTIRGMAPTIVAHRTGWCRRGHRLEPCTSPSQRGKQVCRTCKKEAGRIWMARHRAELRAVTR